MPDFTILAVDNVRRVLDELADIRQLTRQFTWLSRIPVVDALPGEILAYYNNRLTIAPIIARDAEAPIYSANPIRLALNDIPVLKHGRRITQEQLSVLRRIEQGNATRSDNGVFADYLASEIKNLRDGVAARMEYLLAAMLQDTLSYNSQGIITSATWGMPSDLKVTPGTLWSDATNGTPINDIQAVMVTGQAKYGVVFDRITLGRTLFNQIIATAEFRAKAQVYFPFGFTTTNIPANDTTRMSSLMSSLLNMTVEIDDRQTWLENDDGTQTALRYQAVNKAVLTASSYDNDATAWDFGNGPCEEAMPGMVPSMIGAMDGQGDRGPLAYYTAANPTGNPPGLIGWGVGSGYPRRHMLGISAVITGA